MINWLYNAFLGLWVLGMLPKVIWQKKDEQLLSRLFPSVKGFSQKGKKVWIHAISLGEMRATFPLYQALLKEDPKTLFYLSCTTQTGFNEAKSLMPKAKLFFLPLDFSWVMKKLVETLKPDLVLFIEGDFWFNLLSILKQKNIPTFICSAKISEISFKRFSLVSFFAKRLFSLPTQILVQNAHFKMRFEQLGVDPKNVSIVGNIKESFLPLSVENTQAGLLKKRFSIKPKESLIVIGSTHEGEDEGLVPALKPLLDKFPDLRLLFVPRHPARFPKVKRLLEATFNEVDVFSSLPKKARVMLLDRTGMLPSTFRLAKFSIMGGSFVPGIGGHNILEPVLRNTPVLFGPYMEDQKGFVEKAFSMDVGEQISFSTVGEKVEYLLNHSSRLQELKANTSKMQKEAGLPLEKTLLLLP